MIPDLGSLLAAVVALAAVLGLIWVSARLARLGGFAPRPSEARLLSLRDTLALDARRRLLIVRCGARDVLLLLGGTQDLVVGWLDPPARDSLPDEGAAP
ncbi:MAG TPA: flagellar biosynthetic protein FliO [Acetobacteraceae bacterium]|jgi:flagellar protein FliO/FliZ|nr:flagellar biosynthetic protein FliO [Acetobacteraceae bacterium]